MSEDRVLVEALREALQAANEDAERLALQLTSGTTAWHDESCLCLSCEAVQAHWRRVNGSGG